MSEMMKFNHKNVCAFNFMFYVANDMSSYLSDFEKESGTESL